VAGLIFCVFEVAVDFGGENGGVNIMIIKNEINTV
jgi:hypothetical protein